MPLERCNCSHWTSQVTRSEVLHALEIFQKPRVVKGVEACGDLLHVRATLPSALNVINASSVGKLVQLVTASRLILYHKGRVDPMKDECHYQIKH